MKCVLCHRPCRNTCSRGSHGWCANCRDASGYLECSRCRANKAAKSQHSKQAAQQSRAAVAAASAPVYVPSMQVAPPAAQFPGAGKSLSEMDDDEQYDWLLAATKALQAKIEHDSAYLTRCASRGTSLAPDVLISNDLQALQAILETLQLELDEYLMPKPSEPKEMTYTEFLNF